MNGTMKKGVAAGVVLGIGLILWFGLLPDLPDPAAVDGNRIMDTVLDLTDPAQFPHRNVSLPGNREAAEYIAERFREYGLAPPPEAPDYLLEYDGEKANVIGMIPGAHPELGKETILIGGHFDTKAIFVGKELVHEPGAVDNASGTAVMMEIARVMAGEQPARTLIFVGFNEEEAGYMGSDWLAKHPIGGVDPVAMINLDMVGSVLDNPIYICSLGYGDVKYPLSEALKVSGDALNIPTAMGASGRTDHRSFAIRGIPAVNLFCWDNRYYHTVEDTPEKLSPDKLREAGMLVVQWIGEAAY